MSITDDHIQKELENIYRNEYGTIIAYLITKFGVNFIDQAEDIAQETILSALKNWRSKGIPPNPKAWLLRVAYNKSVNITKRNKKINYNLSEVDSMQSARIKEDSIILNDELSDSMLKMIFVCCNGQLKTESQILLVLSSLCGFTRKELAKAFLEKEETIKKRLYRAKKKLREQQISLELPTKKDLTSKLQSVQNCLYLLFNEGYNSSSSNEVIRKDICLEALRLAALLVSSFKDDSPSKALFALFCFHMARFESRIDDKGVIVLFKNQDRKLWNKELINKGIIELSNSAVGKKISVYHLEAGIALQHCIAKDFKSTNWKAIHNLYENLFRLKPSPIIKLNLIITESFLFGTKRTLPKLEVLSHNSKLKHYHLLYATLGKFYYELKNFNKAFENYEKAKELTHNKIEIDLINKKLKKLSNYRF